MRFPPGINRVFDYNTIAANINNYMTRSGLGVAQTDSVSLTTNYNKITL